MWIKEALINYNEDAMHVSILDESIMSIHTDSGTNITIDNDELREIISLANLMGWELN